MNFFIPTKIYSEKDCIKNHRKEISNIGKKAFIITGKTSSRKNGSLNAVTEILDSESISYCIFDAIEENPSVETVLKAAEVGRKEKVDFVIGIGGGSPLDAAKAIALLVKNKEASADELYKNKSMAALPVIAIPTTAGTGSEVTPYAILTLHSEKTKRGISHRIFPKIALVDYTYLESLPKEVLKNTAVDALGHMIESYINVKATLYTKMMCEYAFTLWGSVKEILRYKQIEEEDYEKLMTASTIAGMSISHTGTSLPHGMSYYLTYEKGIPHGKAVGIFLPAYLEEDTDLFRKKRILELLGFDDSSEFKKYINDVLGDVTITSSEIDFYAKGMSNNQGKLANCPYKVDYDKLKSIFKDSVRVE